MPDFERLVARHKDAVYRQMVRVCGNADDAEDALAGALLRAFRASERLEDTESFRSWLTTIGKRVCFRMKKKDRAGRQVSLEALLAAGAQLPESGEPDANELVEIEEMHQCILAAYEDLPPQYKSVYRICAVEGRPATEAAKELGTTVGSVKARLHRARAQVRKSIDQSVCPE